jgi:DHA1 family bicyclomycin/chloramphenicol resistance-like MFS transporter
MRRLAGLAYLAQVVLALGMTLVFSLNLAGDTAFWAFFGWSVSIFFMAGLTFGNLQALAMQRTGHIAGLTASLVTALATVGSVLIAAPVGLAFDGTPVPVMAGAAICSALAWVLLRAVRDR